MPLLGAPQRHPEAVSQQPGAAPRKFLKLRRGPGSSKCGAARPRHAPAVQLPRITSLRQLEIIEMLTSTPMGNVIRALEPSTGTRLVVKATPRAQLRAAMHGDDATREGARAVERAVCTEAAVYNMLRHRSIVRCYDFFSDADTDCYCCVMEDCPGGDLKQFLQGRQASESEAAYYVAQVAAALEHMHSRRPVVIHRDVKTDNVFVAADGTVRLGDFGTAALLLSPAERRQTFCGTVDYLAPETVRHAGTGPEADVWALGVLCYELLTGSTPFEQAGGVNETMAAIACVSGGVRVDPGLPVSPECRQFLEWTMAADPGARMTAAQVLTHPFLTRHVTNVYHARVPTKCTRGPPPRPVPASPSSDGYSDGAFGPGQDPAEA